MDVTELSSKEVGLLMSALDKFRDVISQDGDDVWEPIDREELWELQQKLRPYADLAWYIY